MDIKQEKTITVFGYGSLLSEESTRETVATLKNFRLVRVPGYKRIFNKVGIVFFQIGQVSQDDKYIASCATREDKSYEIICVAFECCDKEFSELYEREHRFKWVLVDGFEYDDKNKACKGRMCTEYSDIEYFLNKCITASRYYDIVGRYYSGIIWRDDILPNKNYLAHCLRAAKLQGEFVYNNYLDSSFLADGTTSIRQYLEAHEVDPHNEEEYTYEKI